MWTIANARLVRAGPNCSPKTRFSPGATGVWSSALALIAIAFQRRTESATCGGMLFQARQPYPAPSMPPQVADSVRRWNAIAMSANALDHTPVAPGEDRKSVV